jgi:hypothetical protein
MTVFLDSRSVLSTESAGSGNRRCKAVNANARSREKVPVTDQQALFERRVNHWRRTRYAALYDHLEWRGLRYSDVKGVFKPKVINSCPDFANN